MIITLSRQSREIAELKHQLASLVALAGAASLNASDDDFQGNPEATRVDSTDLNSDNDTNGLKTRRSLLVSFLQRFKAALERMVAKSESMKGSEQERRELLGQGCSTILMYLQKILSSPNVKRYRQVFPLCQ